MTAYKVLIESIKDSQGQFEEIHGAADYYGGSDVANICGLGYDSPLKVWLRKTGKVEPIQQTEQMRLGQLMEPVLIRMLADKIHEDVSPVNQVWQHPDLDWWIASVDAITDSGQLVEFKTHKIYADKYWSNEAASDSAMCQLQWYLGCSGLPGGYCAALIGGDTDRFYTPYFERDDDVIAQLRDTVERFRELVQADVPPDAGPGDADLIKEHLIKDYDKGLEVDLTATHADVMNEYRKLLDRRNHLSGEWSEIEAGIKQIKNSFLKDSAGAGVIKVGRDQVKLTKVVRQPHTVKGSEFFKVTIRLDDAAE